MNGAVVVTPVPVPMTSLAFWRAYVVTARPYLFFVSGAAGLLGLALAPDMPPGRFVLAALVLYVSYGLGQALTDVFQVDTDTLSSPYRPLVRGEVRRGHVALVSLTGLALCGAALAWLDLTTIPVSLVLVLGLASYTTFKRRWWGGPPWNAWIVGLLPVLGALAAHAEPAALVRDTSMPLAMGSVFGSYAIFVLLGYFKDIEADRATGYQTMPVRFGRRASIIMSVGYFVAAFACSLPLVLGALSARGLSHLGAAEAVGGALWLVGVVLLAASHVRMRSVTRDDQAHPAVAMVVRGFVAMHLGEAVLVRPSLALFGVAVFAVGEAVLRARPERTQI